MEIKDFLDPSHVMIDVRASDKVRLLREFAGRAAVALGLSCAARALRDPDALRNLRHAGDDAALYRAAANDSAKSRPA